MCVFTCVPHFRFVPKCDICDFTASLARNILYMSVAIGSLHDNEAGSVSIND